MNFEIAGRAIYLQHELQAFTCRPITTTITMAANPPPHPAFQPAPIPPSLTTMHTSNTPYHMPSPIHHTHHASSDYHRQHRYSYPPYSHCNPPHSYSPTYSSSVVNATNTNPPSHHLSFNYHHPVHRAPINCYASPAPSSSYY